MASQPGQLRSGAQKGRSVTICYYKEIHNSKTSHSSASSGRAGQACAARPAAVASAEDGGGITTAAPRRDRGAKP
jgi:hypothetical protein